ncbi:ADP glucose pyrophosphorylase [Carex littledalei]|uniref:glucose-1-phosphate adenylyltransferase n=1 Tax=Carex littledalei TaxID=544730 RepID=A0A833RP62_9POAL|nr:ADP glucose pyrophosphorylase [Carex littledalei]
MDDRRASDFGLMKIDNKGRVISFREKPKGDDLKAMFVISVYLLWFCSKGGLSREEVVKKPYIASMGIYVFRRDVLLNLLRMGRAKLKLETKEPKQQMPVYNKRKNGIAKKARDLSILCDTEVLLLLIDPRGKADLVLGPNTNFEDVVNWFVDVSPKERSKRNTDKLHMINSKDDLNLMEVAVENLIQLNTKQKMEMSDYRNRDRTRASAFQQSTNQAVMNHSGPPNGNPMNHGTNLLQPNMNPGSNSDTVSNLLMAAPPGIKEEAAYHSPDAFDDLFAHEWGFGACFPGN